MDLEEDKNKDEKNDLEKIKEKYSVFQGKYGLPEFSLMNEDFLIEKISDVDGEFFLKEVIKIVSEKLSNYFRIVESLLNPVNGPMFNYTIVKTLGPEEKKKLEEIYKKLSKLEIDLLELDIKHSEEKEASFLREVHSVWQEIKEDFLIVLDVVKKNWDAKKEVNGKGYFG